MMRQIIILAILFVLHACGESRNKANKIDTKDTQSEVFFAEMNAIENEAVSSPQVASSLRYTKENGASVLVLVYMSQEGNILKIEEEFNDGENESNGIKTFYMKDNKIFATKEFFADNTNPSKPTFVERISYYDADEKVTSTREKVVEYEEELENTEYQMVEPKACSMERAQNVLNQKGEFETTFQGFVHVDVLSYLVVGEAKSDGYTSALRADYEDATLKILLLNEKKYLNKKIRVEFQKVVDPSGFEYQQYISGAFVD